MEYEIKLTQQEIGLIYQALGELPLKMSLNLFGKLQQAVARQDEAKALPIGEVAG
jgi:hypothetical protein